MCDENYIQLLGYAHEDWQPYHIVSYHVMQTNEDNFAPKGREDSPPKDDKSTMHD